MPENPAPSIEITAFEWVPSFAQGQVRDLRARWACEEFGFPYKVRLISALERPEWYYDDQPWGQVPFLRDGDVDIFESGAILLHLAEKAHALPAPGTQERGRILSWLFAAFNSIEPFLFELAAVSIFSRNEEWAPLRRPSLLEACRLRLQRLETALRDKEWLAGEFSVADIAMATILRSLVKAGGDDDLLMSHPTLSSYLDRATSRPAFARALEAQLAPFAQHDPRQKDPV
ncbi:glutathione S-transferase family protein [Novosphingobium panipatense]|jgi:glutathione S-transferase|uniref:glutathione S-transferase family protein n=1 Tax=Novosphingobium TaxID=165696 RepID=UPI000CDA19EC|nr:glutathione S-transferase family protein [Novosphingobium sp. HII-3]